MSTGRKIYRYLKQIDTTTGLPTGVTKENVEGDPDYVAPVEDYVACPVVAWEPIDELCQLTKACPPGFVLQGDMCVKVNEPNTTALPLLKNNGMKEFLNRRRITNGVPDGLVEENLNGIGVGPYFPPVSDSTTCPKIL